MKKLMIAAVIAFVAIASNAANIKWGLSGYYYDKDGTTDMTYGTAFLYLGTVTASATAFILDGCTYVDHSGYNDNTEVYGQLGAEVSKDAVTSTEAGQAYSIVLVNKEVNTLEGFEGNYAIVNGESAQVGKPTTPVTYYAKFEYADDVTTSNTMSTPEPTSAMLLLLGVAGLALRRKQK